MFLPSQVVRSTDMEVRAKVKFLKTHANVKKDDLMDADFILTNWKVNKI